MSNIPKVKYKFKGHKLPMELMVWDGDNEPKKKIVYAIFPNREYPFLTCGPDGENGFGYEHAALPEGVEPKKKKHKKPDLMGKILVDKYGNREMITRVSACDFFETQHYYYHKDRLEDSGWKFEDGTPLGGES